MQIKKCEKCGKRNHDAGYKYCNKCFLIYKNFKGLDFIREKVRERDNYTCQQCQRIWKKEERRFDVHHLDLKMENVKDYRYDKNNLDRLITLCHKCHLNLYHIKEKMVKNYNKNAK